MAPLKFQGPNGFGAYFYQSFWSTVGDEVSISIFDFLNGGTMDKSENSLL